MHRTIIYSALVALVVSLTTAWIMQRQFEKERPLQIEYVDRTPARAAAFTLDEEGEVVPLDFTKTAEEVMDAVVHIRSTQAARMPRRGEQPTNPFDGDLFDFFFGPGQPAPDTRPRGGHGSGVIINPDGYIVTNNHVVEGADDIDVTLHDNRTYKATLVATDPNTDLALIKIEERQLPTLAFADSDAVKVGEWVLAVGNPFNLNSTVTAGIVSAKGRNINILREQYAIESFIQTDAAINPGNSGGALVNLQGGLIGINTAIASPTGTYSGYGFAVPANIVSKVIGDLMEYGAVQRGFLGVLIRGVNGDLARVEGLDVTQGVYVDSLLPNSAALNAGVRQGDVILEVDGAEVNTASALQEAIALKRPGDVVELTIRRDGDNIGIPVTLTNRSGNTEIVSREVSSLEEMLGARFETLSEEEAAEEGLEGGVKVVDLLPGLLSQETTMREGFIITRIDNRQISSAEELERYLQGRSGGVMLEGFYPGDQRKYYYAFGLDQNQ